MVKITIAFLVAVAIVVWADWTKQKVGENVSAYVSVIGLLNWDENIIDNTFLDVFIALFKTETIAMNMLERFEDILVYECGELEVTLPNPTFFKRIVKSWADNQTEVWKAYYSAQQSVEMDASNILLGATQEVLTGKDGTTKTRNLSHNGTNNYDNEDNVVSDNSVYGFNEGGAKPKDHSVVTDNTTSTNTVNYTDAETGKDEKSLSHTKVFTDYGKFFDTAEKFDMLTNMNVINKIVCDFKDKFCLSVY